MVIDDKDGGIGTRLHVGGLDSGGKGGRGGIHRKGEPENRTLGPVGLEPEESPMLLDHRAAQRQAQAHAFGFGGEEGGKELLLDRDRKSTRLNSSHSQISY